ncbi:hypothetical protein E2C01_087826 [Portunus trituberculatus]|uniref:Uncharacterized protein n=1 Tax=Portunus trituberculatus TaxID=210409 RepID=A0A5B7J7N5_PORTR|nr:hypothetical protein [Portunus trituberculatus]
MFGEALGESVNGGSPQFLILTGVPSSGLRLEPAGGRCRGRGLVVASPLMGLLWNFKSIFDKKAD